MNKKTLDQNALTVIELLIVLFSVSILFFALMKFTDWFYPAENTWQYILIFIFLYLFILGVFFTASVLLLENVLKTQEDKYLVFAFFSSIFMSFLLTYGSLSYFGINFSSDTKRKNIADIKQAQSSITAESMDIDKRANLIV